MVHGLTHFQYERGMNMDMNQIIAGVVLSKACAVSPDAESKKEGVSKKVNVRVKFDGAKLADVFEKALSGTVIAWQNGVGRKSFDTLKDNQTVEITFTAPASRAQVDPIDAVIASAKAAGMTVEQYLMAELKKRQA